MKETDELSSLHPPPPPISTKFVGCEVEIEVLERKMELGGYTNVSQFLRDIIEDYGNTKQKEVLRTILQKIDGLQERFLKKFQTISLGTKTMDRKEREEEYQEARESSRSAELRVQGDSRMGEVVREIKEATKELGDIRKLLKPISEGEDNGKE